MNVKAKLVFNFSFLLLALGLQIRANEDGGSTAISRGTRAMDFRSVPQSVLHFIPKWSGSLLVMVDHSGSVPVVYAFDRSGKFTVNAVVQFEGARSTTIADFASGEDGTIWACGFSSSTTGQLSDFLVKISDGGRELQVIRTTPYEPLRITVSPDGSIWTLGFEYPPYSPGQQWGRIDTSLNVLRQFDFSGKALSSAIPLSTIGEIEAIAGGQLAASSDRIAWYAPSSKSTADDRYFEYFPAVKTLKSYSAAPTETGRAVVRTLVLTPSNTVYVYAASPPQAEGKSSRSLIFKLDRPSEQWLGVNLSAEPILELRGNDGESLVLSGAKDPNTLRLVEVP